MAVFETWLESDLQKPVIVKKIAGAVFTQDNDANLVGVIVTDGGEPVTLSGTVYGYVIIPTGETVEIEGTIDGNKAYFVLSQECYVNGHISIAIKLTDGTTITTLGACSAYVYKSKTSNEVVPTGTPIPDLSVVEEAIGTYAEAAEDSAEDSEAYAVGTRGGVDVESTDPTYHNNSKYYSEVAQTAATSASAAYGTNLLAPTYSATATYAVGDHVIYNGGYYECNTAISTAEAWNSAHWTQLTVGGETSALKSAVDEINEDVNGVISYNYTEGKKITAESSTTYSIDDDPDSCVSELIEITWDWDTSTYVRYYYNGVQGETLNYRIIFFDENEDYIGYRGTDGVTYRAVTNFAGGKYVRFSFKRGTVGKLMQNLAPQTVYWEASGSVSSPGLVQNLGDLDDLETTEKSSAVEAINEVNEKAESFSGEINAIADELTELKTATAEEKTVSETNDIDITMHDGYLAETGIKYETGNYLNYGYTDKIAVQPGDVIRGYNNTTALIEILVLCEYNGETFKNGYNPKAFPYTVPDGVTHIAVSTSATYKSTLRLTLTRASTILVPVLGDRVTALENAVDGKIDKDGNKQVAVKNCQFMYYSPNLFDKTVLTEGLINTSTGAIVSTYTQYRTSDWIEVDSSTNYTFSAGTTMTVYICWYKSDKTYISGEQSSSNVTLTKQSPSNAKYIRFSILYANIDNDVQFEKGNTATRYMGYGTGYLKPEYAPVINEDFILNLPSKVYALVGTEINIYFDNLVEGHDTDYEWDVTCSTSSIGMHLERGYRIVASTEGTYTLTFTAKRKSDGSTVTKSTSLIVIGTSAGSGDSASVIVLGDSTTDNGTVISKLHDNFTGDGMTVSTLGTRGTSPNNHEGRSGWRFSFYFTKASETYTDGRGTIYNPFYNPTSQTFDATYYFANSGIAKPDYFFINLGINDTFGFNSDKQFENGVEEIIGYCDSMIESVQDASASTKVCVCLTIPPNYSQDAFGREYKTGQNRNRYKRNNMLWVKRLIEEYEGRESEGIYIIPINLALDTRYNMGFDTQPVNARNTDITYQMPIGNGGVHPVTSGYWQIADVYTAFIKAHASD